MINTINDYNKLLTELNPSCNSLISNEYLTFFYSYHHLHYLIEFLETDESDTILLGLPDIYGNRKAKGYDFFRNNRQISVIKYCINPDNYRVECSELHLKKLKSIVEQVLLYEKNLSQYLTFTVPDVSFCNYDSLLNICDSILQLHGLQKKFSIPDYSFKLVKESFYELLTDYPDKNFSFNLTLDNFSLCDIEGLSFMLIHYPGIIYDKNFHILLSTAISVGVC
jgi:hypothetical protein